MALFERKRKRPTPNSGAMAEMLLQGHDMIQRTGHAHRERWGLGSAVRWDLDQVAGNLRWTFDDYSAEAPAQIIGSHSPNGGSWMWAWANDSLPEGMRSASERVRDWGAAEGQAALTSPRLEDVDEEQAADLAAIAFRVLRATGFYAAPAGRSRLFMTFGSVTITDASGERQTFDIDVT